MPSPGQRVSQAEFKRRGEALCQEFQKTAKSSGAGSKPTVDEIDQILTLLRDYQSRLDQLGIPEGLEEEVAEFKAKWGELISVIEKARSLRAAGQEDAMDQVEPEGMALSNDLERLAGQLGMSSCFGSGSTNTSRKS